MLNLGLLNQSLPHKLVIISFALRTYILDYATSSTRCNESEPIMFPNIPVMDPFNP